MSDPIRFLVSFGQAVSTMALYNDGHPARERAVDRSYQCLRDLQQDDPNPRFSFLGEETIYQDTALRELGDWEGGTRLAQPASRLAHSGYAVRGETLRTASKSRCRLRPSHTRSARKQHRLNRCTEKFSSAAGCRWRRPKQ